LVAGIVPGVERQPLKKLKTDENALLTLLYRWRDEAVRSGHKILSPRDPVAGCELAKQCLVETARRLGIEIRGFNPKLRQAEQRHETLRTPKGEPIPANTLATGTGTLAAAAGHPRDV
jgi:hypothetical protein